MVSVPETYCLTEGRDEAPFEQWWWFAIMVVTMKGRPVLHPGLIGWAMRLMGGTGLRQWDGLSRALLALIRIMSRRFGLSIRAFELRARVGGASGPERHPQEWYLKAATMFAEPLSRMGALGGSDPVDKDTIQQMMALTGQGRRKRR